MHAVWLGLAATAAAIAIPAAPAGAQTLPAAGFAAGPAFAPGSHGVTVHRGEPGPSGDVRRGRGDDGDRDRRDRRRHRRSDAFFVYDRDWQGDSAWRSNSFNDWWHDRPERAYPRWVSNNSNCERLWWSGGGWRC